METLDPYQRECFRKVRGWLELGNIWEAAEELQEIPFEYRVPPALLKVRWHVLAKCSQWGECLAAAQAMIRLSPRNPDGWLNCAASLAFLGEVPEAFDLLQPVAVFFPDNAEIPYNLARYACRLGRFPESRDWLKLALDKTFGYGITAVAQYGQGTKPLKSGVRDVLTVLPPSPGRQ